MVLTARPDHDLVTGVAFFTKHAGVFISAVRECIVNMGENMSGKQGEAFISWLAQWLAPYWLFQG